MSDDQEADDILDYEIFNQLLSVDDEDHEFLKGVVLNYLQQAERTFEEIRSCIQEGDLPGISKLGHFLKGSSASLGLKRVKDSCERLNQIGKYNRDSGTKVPESQLLGLAANEFKTTREEFEKAGEFFAYFFENY